MKYGSIKGYLIDWESNRTTSRTMKSMPQQSRAYSSEMFVNMLTVHCDQNNRYEITINGFKVRKINEIRNVIFVFCYGKPYSALRPKLGCSPS